MIDTPNRPTVLVVDDETGILDSLNILLRNEGFAPYMAHGGKAGLDRIGELGPDIVLTDIRMPNVDRRRDPRRGARKSIRTCRSSS